MKGAWAEVEESQTPDMWKTYSYSECPVTTPDGFVRARWEAASTVTRPVAVSLG